VGEARRLARAVQELLGGSYSHAKDEVEAGHVTVNGAVITSAGAWVGDGDVVAHRPELPRRTRAPRTPPLPIVHLDEHVLVIDKPSGLLVHPTADGEQDTVLSRGAAELARREARPGRLFVVHRLDQGTSGVMVLGRSHGAAEALQDQFRVHGVTRRYLALVRGDVREEVVIERDIGRPRPGARRGALAPGRGGQRALTTVRPVKRGGAATLVEAELGTGRTHQVRVHLSYLGHPVLGDAIYGDPKSDPVEITRLALHAAHLGFRHPESGEWIEFNVALPPDLARAWQKLARSGTRSHPA
jgi:23S rRNA pseudouridine1911/1915/1917 synthase